MAWLVRSVNFLTQLSSLAMCGCEIWSTDASTTIFWGEECAEKTAWQKKCCTQGKKILSRSISPRNIKLWSTVCAHSINCSSNIHACIHIIMSKITCRNSEAMWNFCTQSVTFVFIWHWWIPFLCRISLKICLFLDRIHIHSFFHYWRRLARTYLTHILLQLIPSKAAVFFISDENLGWLPISLLLIISFSFDPDYDYSVRCTHLFISFACWDGLFWRLHRLMHIKKNWLQEASWSLERAHTWLLHFLCMSASLASPAPPLC